MDAGNGGELGAKALQAIFVKKSQETSKIYSDLQIIIVFLRL